MYVMWSLSTLLQKGLMNMAEAEAHGDFGDVV
jgi:hypothetical protein